MKYWDHAWLMALMPAGWVLGAILVTALAALLAEMVLKSATDDSAEVLPKRSQADGELAREDPSRAAR
jgi:hypothetical protein